MRGIGKTILKRVMEKKLCLTGRIKTFSLENGKKAFLT
jgi:hypothetical protein